jgi:hypothetical protein
VSASTRSTSPNRSAQQLHRAIPLGTLTVIWAKNVADGQVQGLVIANGFPGFSTTKLEITWFDWSAVKRELCSFTKDLIMPRRRHPVFLRNSTSGWPNMFRPEDWPSIPRAADRTGQIVLVADAGVVQRTVQASELSTTPYTAESNTCRGHNRRATRRELSAGSPDGRTRCSGARFKTNWKRNVTRTARAPNDV